MAAFPGALPVFAGFTSSHTLAADNHAAQHNLEQAEIVNIATKLGYGNSVASGNTVLRGNAAGVTVWGQVNLTTDITGVLPATNGGTGQASLSNLTMPSATLSSPTITGTVSGGAIYISPTLTTPAIADFTNAVHTHGSPAQGGTLNGSTAIQSATLKAAQMLNGIIKQRQGGATGDASWATAGSSNIDTSAKDVFIQIGSITTSSSADVTVTFPVAFNQVPVVFAQSQAQIGLAQTSSITATNFAVNNYTTGNVRQAVSTSWIAIGQ